MDKEIARKIYNSLNKEELNYLIDNRIDYEIIDHLDDIKNIEERVERISSKLVFDFLDLPQYIIENEAVDLLEVLEKHFLK